MRVTDGAAGSCSSWGSQERGLQTPAREGIMRFLPSVREPPQREGGGLLVVL